MASSASYSTNLGISAVPETKNPELFAEMIKVYGALHGLQAALDAYTGPIPQDKDIWSSLTPNSTILLGNMSRLYIKMDEAITAGLLVNIYDNSGMRGRLASASANRPARGFCTGDAAIGEYAEIILLGLDVLIATLTPGNTYYLGLTGHFSATPPTTSGYLHQQLGYALTADTFYFNPEVRGSIVP